MKIPRRFCWLLFLVLACCRPALAQADAAPGDSFLWLHHIPMRIATEGHSAKRLSENVLSLLGPQVTITLTQPGSGSISQLYQGAPLLSPALQRQLKWCVVSPRESAVWHPLAAPPAIILNRHLAPGDSLFLCLAGERDTAVLMRLLLIRPLQRPEMEGYRMVAPDDTAGLREKAMLAQIKFPTTMVWEPAPAETLNVAPGMATEILFRNPLAYTDTVLAYRMLLPGAAEKPGWQRTGHLLRLPPMSSQARYTLEVKYLGAQAVLAISCKVMPRWFETNKWRAILSVVAAAIVVAMVWLFQRKRLHRAEAKIDRLTTQLQVMQQQLNPHFFSNSLSSIMGLLSVGKHREATRYLATFANLVQEALRNSYHNMYSLREELDMLENYLSIEQLRFPFQYSITVAAGMDTDAVQIPPLLLQPLAENAVQHGVRTRGAAGIICIEAGVAGPDCFIRIADNGSAPAPDLSGCSVRKQYEQQGNGIRFTMGRVEQLEYLMRPRKISLTSRKEDGFTILEFTLYRWLE